MGLKRRWPRNGGDSWAPLMEEMTELLGIMDWGSYVQMKTKYNLTQY
ncbi:MAG: hypothetical protein U9N46_05045 [Euryarchaeota archaeon]|nr:hypothetical protein [Euryarchaeota archaeon]